MSKYVIVPKIEYVSEAVEASSAEDALVCNFNGYRYEPVFSGD